MKLEAQTGGPVDVQWQPQCLFAVHGLSPTRLRCGSGEAQSLYLRVFALPRREREKSKEREG